MPKQEIQSISGWLLLGREEDANELRTGDWYIAWESLFGTKKAAIAFAKDNNWLKPYRAVRGQTRVMEPSDAS